MDQELLDILRHSLGGEEYEEGKRYRNYYVADGDDIARCHELVKRGHMLEHPASEITGDMPWFTVTDQGKRTVHLHSLLSPKLTPGQKRYRDWLKADCNMKFGDWLKRREYVDYA